MKTKLLLCASLSIAILAFTLLPARAQQDIYFGVKGGIGIPNLQAGSDNSPVSKGYSSRLGPYIGVFGDFHLTKVFSIQPEVNYSSQGGKKNGVQAVPSSRFADMFPPGTQVPPYFYTDYKSVAKLNYIEVPVLAKFTFPLGTHWHFIADAGPYAGFLVSAKNVISNASGKVYIDEDETQPAPVPGDQQSVAGYFNGTEDIKDQIHTVNVGVQGGIGLSFDISNEGYLFFHAGGNYGFLNIQKDEENGKNHTGAATLVLGYALKLNSR